MGCLRNPRVSDNAWASSAPCTTRGKPDLNHIGGISMKSGEYLPQVGTGQ